MILSAFIHDGRLIFLLQRFIIPMSISIVIYLSVSLSVVLQIINVMNKKNVSGCDKRFRDS